MSQKIPLGFHIILLWILSVTFLLTPDHAFARQSQHRALNSNKIYKKVLKKYTRTAEVYQREDFYASLKWFATLQSEEMIDARVDKITKIYEYDNAKSVEIRTAEQEKYSKYIVFYVSFYSYQYQFEDLSREKNQWKLILETSATKVSPVKIEKISKLSPLDLVLYPYSNGWSEHYYVYFSKPRNNSDLLNLSVFGPAGKSTLVWQK